jgi:hypothetical protein
MLKLKLAGLAAVIAAVLAMPSAALAHDRDYRHSHRDSGVSVGVHIGDRDGAHVDLRLGRGHRHYRRCHIDYDRYGEPYRHCGRHYRYSRHYRDRDYYYR